MGNRRQGKKGSKEAAPQTRRRQQARAKGAVQTGHWRGRSSRRARAGGACHAPPRGKGQAREVQGFGAQRWGVEAACLLMSVLPGTKLLHSESSLTFMQKSWALFRRPPSFLPVAGTGQQQGSELGPTEEGGVRRPMAAGSTAPTRDPRSAVEIPQTPAAWNARRRLLHSGPNVFVITPDLPPAPPSPRVTALHCGAGARSPRTSRTPQTAGELPKPSPRSAPPSARLAAATVALSLAPARGPALRRPVIPRPGTAPIAPGGHSRSGLLQPIPSLLSSPQLLPRLPRHSSLPTSPRCSSRAPCRRLQPCPAKPRAKNENSH